MAYRVYKVGGKRCVRKFDTIEEAKRWCWLRESRNDYYIEWRYEDEPNKRRIYVF